MFWNRWNVLESLQSQIRTIKGPLHILLGYSVFVRYGMLMTFRNELVITLAVNHIHHS